MKKAAIVAVICAVGAVAVVVGAGMRPSVRAASAFNKAVAETRIVPVTFANAYDSVLDPHVAAAEKHFQEAITLDPKNSRYHLEYGRLLCKIDRTDKCRAEVAVAIQLDPMNTDAQTVLTRLDDRKRAEDLERQAALQRETNEEFVRRFAQEQALQRDLQR